MVAPKRGVLHKSIAEIVLDAPVRDFLIAHVTQGLADGQALAGRFKVVGVDRTEGICRSVISSGTDFVSRSAALAQLLYDASSKPDGTDSRVSDGTLVVARCAATDGSHTNVSFVALLKLDPDDAFLADDGTDAKGRPVVKLVTQPNVLPTPRERIQKAAFVRATGSEYDALAVDRQRPGEVVSLSFLDGFLGLEHVYDAKERTSRLYKTLHRTFDQTIVWGAALGPGVLTVNPFAGMWLLPLLLLSSGPWKVAVAMGALAGSIHGAVRSIGVIRNVCTECPEDRLDDLLVRMPMRWRWFDGLGLLAAAGVLVWMVP